MTPPVPRTARPESVDEQARRRAVASELDVLLRALPVDALEGVLRHARDAVCEHLQDEREAQG